MGSAHRAAPLGAHADAATRDDRAMNTIATSARMDEHVLPEGAPRPRTAHALRVPDASVPARPRSSSHRVLPGFGLGLGYTVLYLGLVVLIPLSAAFMKTA